jgi:Putative prokaryotic signal transducing protein
VGQIRVRTYASRMAAEMAQGLLETSGIRSSVSADDAGGAYPFSLLGGGARLMIDESDREQAEAVLATLD